MSSQRERPRLAPFHDEGGQWIDYRTRINAEDFRLAMESTRQTTQSILLGDLKTAAMNALSIVEGAAMQNAMNRIAIERAATPQGDSQ